MMRSPPKSNFSKALNYFQGLTDSLPNYLSNSDARLDNNVAERAICPLTIGRKNWLFVGSEDGGRASATILSLVQTCQNLDINHQEYLEDVLRRIMSHPAKQIHELLHDKWLVARTQQHDDIPQTEDIDGLTLTVGLTRSAVSRAAQRGQHLFAADDVLREMFS